MGIPNNQLETWSNLGAQTNAQMTYKSIRNILDQVKWTGLNKNIYLQGSYRNHTNIYGNSDVDVVVEFRATDLLSFQEFLELKHSVMDILAQRGNKSVTIGNKSAKVKRTPLDADVVVCQQAFVNSVECIRFFAQDGRKIINYPKKHHDSGADKNKRTNETYKPTVRIFKNMRERLIRDGKLDSETAPSYFVECLLYNVPDSNYINVCDCTVLNVLTWLAKNVNSDELECQNGQKSLYGDLPEQWSKVKAISFVLALWDLWENWGK